MSELDIMFPTKKVKIGEGIEIEMHPISIEDLSKVLGSFMRLAQFKANGMSDAELALVAMKEIIQIIPYCTDYPLSKVPHYAFPDILEVFIEQNMTAELTSKWMALAGKIKGQSVIGQSKK